MSIELKHVGYTYAPGLPTAKEALRNINLTFRENEFVGIIGHTGSGKSTLIQMLNGLIRPTEGKIYLDGEEYYETGSEEAKKQSKKQAKRAIALRMRQIRQKVGLVFQYPEHQLFEMTVAKDIAFGPNNLGLNQEEIERRIDTCMEMVGLGEELKEKSPIELSGGQKRRVAIAGVLAMNPTFLVLDEPTAGLDPKGRDEILGKIRALQQKNHISVILVSHSMEDVAHYADRIIAIDDGQVRFDGTPRDVFAHGQELQDMGLGIPQMTELGMRLREKGVPISETLLSVDEMIAALKEVYAC